MWAAREALTLTDSLKTREVAGLDPRTVESLAVPAATLAVTMGLSESAAGEMLEFLAAQTEREEGREPDHVQLVHSILASTVTLDRGVMTTVGELLGRTTGGFSETHEPLERVGVAIVAEQRGPREFASERSAVFFDCKTIRRYLLKDTEWTSQQIDTHLLRLETATRSRRRIGGRLVWGVEFEWTWFAEHFLDKGDGENAQTTTAEY